MLYIKKNLKICFYICVLWCLLLNFIPLAVSSPSENIHYIKNGWIKEKNTGLIGEYTIQQFTTISNDEFEIKLKKQEGIEEHNDKDNDLQNIPCRLYEKTDEIWIETNYTLIDTKYFNLKTKEEDILRFNIDRPYDCYKLEIGFGTVTYEGVSDVIITTGAITFNDIYNADVVGGWNQVYKLNDSQYTFNCSIYVGNDTMPSWLNETGTQIDCIKDYTSSSNYILRTNHRDSEINFNGVSYKVSDIDDAYNRPLSNYLGGDITIINSMLYCNYNYMLVYFYSSLDNCYFNNTFFYNCGLYSTSSKENVHIRNCTFYGGKFGFYNIPSIDVKDSEFKNIDRSFQAPQDANYYNLKVINSISNDISWAHNNKYLNFYNIETEDDKLNIVTNGKTGDIVRRYYSFDLITDEDTDITVYYNNGSIAFQSLDDNDGVVSEYLLMTMWNSSLGDGTDCYFYTPYRLIIQKSGYVTYNCTINNSFKPMDYQIYLMEGDIMNVNLSIEVILILIWISLVFLLYKTNRNYLFMPLGVGGVQFLLMGAAYTLGYYPSIIEYLLVASAIFLILSIYKTYKGVEG